MYSSTKKRGFGAHVSHLYVVVKKVFWDSEKKLQFLDVLILAVFASMAMAKIIQQKCPNKN